MEEQINLKIDNINIVAKPHQTILEIARKNGINIPTLCFLKDVVESGNCRVCVVEIKGAKNLATACNTEAVNGMEVFTSSNKVLEYRKKTVELLLSNHNKNCLSCGKNLNCDLQKLSLQFGCDENKFKGEQLNFELDNSSACIVRDNNKCILCGRCIEVCKKMQATSAIAKMQRGFETYVGCANNKGLNESTCVGCGQCVLVCPTGALLEKGSINQVVQFLNDTNLFVVAQIAPAVRVALSEEFGYEIGTFDEGKMVTALKMIGFDKVFDINTGADFTVIEEAQELLERVNENKNLPMFSSCCPAWFRYLEKHYPNYEKNLSTCKSPSEMLGSLIKNCYSKKIEQTPNNIKVVAIMPCTAKKGELQRGQDVDVVLTTRELAQLIKMKNIDFVNLKPQHFDAPLGNYSGAGLIFGTTGGVTEAVLRTAMEKLNGKPINEMDFNLVRNSQGIKEVELKTPHKTLHICIVNGLANANKVMKQVVEGKKHFDFIEVMACPGGCVNGGGQPYVNYKQVSAKQVIKKRAKGLYKKDKELEIRQSHKNADMNAIYEEFLIPNKNMAHKLLHYKPEKK